MTGSGSLDSLIAALADSSFEGEILDDPSSRVVYGTDNSIYQLEPTVIVIPTSTSDVAEIVKANNALAEPFGLVARGGGTGTNGQSLTAGLVIDFKRSMNRIIEVDSVAKTAIVEPGVVMDQLNHRAAQVGLRFAPNTSAGSRATIGGMVATDAAGKGSLVHGRTNHHVVSMEVVLFDGSVVTLTNPNARSVSTSGEDLPSSIASQVSASLSGIGVGLLPKVIRGWSGYNIAGAAGSEIDYTKLFCGAEGTLGLVTKIELSLIDNEDLGPTALGVFDSFDDAILASLEIRKTAPAVIEAVDSYTVGLAGQSAVAAQIVEDYSLADKSMLLVSYPSFVQPNQVKADLDSFKGNFTILDEIEAAKLWQLRADSVGYLARPSSDGASAVAFIEDTMVPPDSLADYVAEFKALLDSYKLNYGMFGHADVGCIHVRPVLNLENEIDRGLVRELTERVNDLVKSYGGVLWGEHGRGFRAEFTDLPEELLLTMREIKTAFDPRNCFNPRKLYTPLTEKLTLLKVDSISLRGEADQLVETDYRQEFDSAFACNGNGICHHWGSTASMCPSYKATLDPRLSPKGRADLLRAWSRNPQDDELADSVADSLHQCLSCNACTSDCPVAVDIPELKSKFLSLYGAANSKERLRSQALGSFEANLPKLSKLPANGVLTKAAELALGLVDLPKVRGVGPRRTASKSSAGYVSNVSKPGDATVIVLSDAFSLYLEPEVAAAALGLLQKLGEKPALSRFVPSGKYFHVKGQVRKFAKSVKAQTKFNLALQETGLPIVSLEPVVQLLHNNEYPKTNDSFSSRVVGLHEYLLERIDSGVTTGVTAALFDHCSSRTAGEQDVPYSKALSQAGVEVKSVSLTCCGMAGIFGHEKENHELSKKIFVDNWQPQLERHQTAELVAPGYSCRTQARRFGFDVSHPVVLLNELL